MIWFWNWSLSVSFLSYQLLDLNQWLLPYESSTLTTELSRSFLTPKRPKCKPSWLSNYLYYTDVRLYAILIEVKQDSSQKYHDHRSKMTDVGEYLYTNMNIPPNSIHDIIWLTSTLVQSVKPVYIISSNLSFFISGLIHPIQLLRLRFLRPHLQSSVHATTKLPVYVLKRRKIILIHGDL